MLIVPAAAGGAPLLRRADLDGDRLVLSVDPRGQDLTSAALVGPRARVAAQVSTDPAGGVSLAFDLRPTRWGIEGLALPSGDYALELGAGRLLDGVLPQDVLTELFRAELLAETGGLVLRVSAPLREDERGPDQQRRLWLRHLLPQRREEAVCFESFYGRAACDNPLGIDRALARLRPDLTRYWCVADRSVAVPQGAVPVVQGSAEWWRVRAQARLLVVNDWLRWTRPRRRGQRVLQTWHGTMLKRLALDRPVKPRLQRVWVLRQSLRWNALLAQNAYSADRFRTSYAFRGPIWVTGYPRNDGLLDPDRARRVRELLGIGADVTVVLWAPTWRDDRAGLVDHLDGATFAADLPADHVLLVRGHSRTLAHGQDLRGEKLVDVTTWPDVADLMLVADVLVTDYSSVMFDFAATGRPIVFYVPDVQHYADVLRGFYFDLHEQAPGPVVGTAPELLDAVVRARSDAGLHAERYAAWQERFTPLDADAGSGERVVQELLRRRWLR